MDFNKNEAGPLAASPAKEPGVKAEEIELYDELIVFAALPPEEQRRLMAHPKQPATTAVEPPFAPVSPPAAIESVEVEIEPEPLYAAPLNPSPVFQLVEVESSEPAAEPTSGFETCNEEIEAVDCSEELFDRSRTGPLLAGLNVAPDFVFGGDLSRGVCLACGSESGADDLFCVGCGVFIDNIGSTPTVNPLCGECGESVEADEIFCPWCGTPPV